MPVVPRSHFSLVQARKALEKAYLENRWDDIKACDIQLAENLNRAFDDNNIDPATMIDELERILKTYAELVTRMPEQAINRVKLAPPMDTF